MPLFAPDKNRWKLEKYTPTQTDLDFCQVIYIQWNTMTHGIQRVDACQTKEGQLVELES